MQCLTIIKLVAVLYNNGMESVYSYNVLCSTTNSADYDKRIIDIFITILITGGTLALELYRPKS